MTEEDAEGDDLNKPTTTFSAPTGHGEDNDGNVPADEANNNDAAAFRFPPGSLEDEDNRKREQEEQQKQHAKNADHEGTEPRSETGEDTDGGRSNSNGVSGSDGVGGEDNGAPVLLRNDVGSEEHQQHQEADVLAGPSQGEDKLQNQHQRDSAGNTETASAIGDAAAASQLDSPGEVTRDGSGDRSAPTTALHAPPGWPPYCDPNYRMPGEIDVAVALDSGEVCGGSHTQTTPGI